MNNNPILLVDALDEHNTKEDAVSERTVALLLTPYELQVVRAALMVSVNFDMVELSDDVVPTVRSLLQSFNIIQERHKTYMPLPLV